ncbi:uncharacterized protein LOC125241730 [Leguminivora glycinivorella]|uniref:uncharacterized protein LOC125241730 n=1 Tax=Leguminivora glycinivorella TaxID=1035111 RepID=UPI00200BC9B4|nr:uncharacterized protein LOC125241730 [Leguminivora glycinivorella]
MDKYQDKENVKVKTRIPLPLPPLPALPNHLLKKISERPPLNTLAGPNGLSQNVPSSLLCVAGPSNAKNKSIVDRLKSPFQIDTKFVTMQRGCEYLDFNFVAYQDDKRRVSEPTVITVSSDEENESNEKEIYFTDKDSLANKRRMSASTPALNTLVPARVKNIKRSLKRPHSRELQGLTPLENREKVDDRVKRRLNFNQTVRERMQTPDLSLKSYMANMDRDYAGEILSYLLQAERKTAALPRVKSETRAGVIIWLMKINGVDGNPATIQTAVWYLDAVLATGNVTLENMQLVAAAAYWIATKHHGPLTPASKLVKYANHAFTHQRLLEAEKVILARLKFPLLPVVPQDYIWYFAWWCNHERPGEIEVATTFLCLCGLMVNKSLCSEYPSVVAAASVRNALLLLKKKELIPRLQKCPAYVAAKKKAANLSHICAILRHAVRVVGAKNYSYKFIFEQYGMPPKYIAQTIVSSANELAVMDTLNTAVIF